LRADLDARAHLEAGSALAGLRDEGVLIVGSGYSYHNLPRMFHPDARSDAAARSFDDWLAATVSVADPGARADALARWWAAPGARECHPRAEHLLPLMVAAGAGAGDAGWRPYTEVQLGKPVCAVQFGGRSAAS
jgi:aromatic ring-opening dioxygenase catalytic subunit (LigB family)